MLNRVIISSLQLCTKSALYEVENKRKSAKSIYLQFAVAAPVEQSSKSRIHTRRLEIWARHEQSPFRVSRECVSPAQS